MSRSYFIAERARRIKVLHKQIRDVPDGVFRRRLVAAFALKWGLRRPTVESYLEVLEDAGLIVTDGDLVRSVEEEVPE